MLASTIYPRRPRCCCGRDLTLTRCCIVAATCRTSSDAVGHQQQYARRAFVMENNTTRFTPAENPGRPQVNTFASMFPACGIEQHYGIAML